MRIPVYSWQRTASYQGCCQLPYYKLKMSDFLRSHFLRSNKSSSHPSSVHRLSAQRSQNQSLYNQSLRDTPYRYSPVLYTYQDHHTDKYNCLTDDNTFCENQENVPDLMLESPQDHHRIHSCMVCQQEEVFQFLNTSAVPEMKMHPSSH